MRVVSIEDEMGMCTAENVSDVVVETLGAEDDWEMVTIDDVSTPGSFWLNMMQPKDENGDRVGTEDVIAGFMSRRIAAVEDANHGEESPTEPGFDQQGKELDEEELGRILADLDPL